MKIFNSKPVILHLMLAQQQAHSQCIHVSVQGPSWPSCDINFTYVLGFDEQKIIMHLFLLSYVACSCTKLFEILAFDIMYMYLYIPFWMLNFCRVTLHRISIKITVLSFVINSIWHRFSVYPFIFSIGLSPFCYGPVYPDIFIYQPLWQDLSWYLLCI